MLELRQRVPELGQVEKVKPLLGGACQENLLVTTASGRFVLRSDAASSLPGSLSRRKEFAVIAAARRAGVLTPEARWLTADLLRPGADAYFLDFVEGIALGGKVLREPNLEQARAVLPQQLAANLARLHQVEQAEVELTRPEDPIAAGMAMQRQTLDRLPHKRPGLELAYRWLDCSRPVKRPVRLTHGDYRVGNFLVDASGLKAVLDWEFAHWGDPVEDVAWLCVRDWRFGNLDKAAGGLTSRSEFCRLYAEAGAEVIDPAVLHWWEVFGNLRWGAGALAQGLRFLEAGEPRIELLAIARRVAEMEYEAVRLIERGPEKW